MRHDDIQFHNVAQTRDVDDHDGLLLQRVPEAVRDRLNEGAQDRMCHPAGVELRFVPDGPVEITLSTRPGSAAEGTVRVFWGPIQDTREWVVGTDPETIEITPPERLDELTDEATDDLAFDPAVCRVVLPGEHRGGHVFYHGMEGDVRPPRDAELPDRRYLAYGTSITEGEAPLAEHLNYVSQTARRLDADLINLGSCGTAYCDKAMAEYIAARDDWDVATLALSINMVDTFSRRQFRERAASMIDTVAGANPEKPVAVVTIYTNARDVCEDADPDSECEAFRRILRDVVTQTPHSNVFLLEGQRMLPDVGGLTTDLVHPGDNAMIRMGENVASELDERL